MFNLSRTNLKTPRKCKTCGFKTLDALIFCVPIGADFENSDWRESKVPMCDRCITYNRHTEYPPPSTRGARVTEHAA